MSNLMKKSEMTEEDIKIKYINPAIEKSGWDINKNVKFEFRIAMIKCSEKYLESIKTKFSVVYKKNKSYILVNTNEVRVAI